MAARSQAHYELAKRLKPDVILLAHGAALVNPEDAQFMLDHTDCHGIQLGSSIERMAVEAPMEERAAGFQANSFFGSCEGLIYCKKEYGASRDRDRLVTSTWI